MRSLSLLLLPVLATVATAAQSSFQLTPGWREYFSNEVATIEQGGIRSVKTVEQWTERRDQYRRELLDMLGLWPMPERTALNPVTTGKIEHDLFTVEKLHFQASPQLFVTANLWLPRGVTSNAPAILYVCGHSRAVTNGVSCGNKTGYQQHGAWFARNGYVCLMIDTLQLGEIQGAHRGTHNEGQWWWNSRGYTPAGVEAWFGIRALDYLSSRPEVDRERIGMTGRSGGGIYTWLVAALDDRVKVAAPIAGMTDMRNQVLDGCVDGHCDCMFQLNTRRWDYPMIGALIAPRPLLIGNSDKDSIFPLDGVVRTHEQIRHIYRLYGKAANLGLLITEGEHKDTQELQVPVFRWFNRFLKKEQPLIEMAAKPFFAPEQLRAFDRLPEEQRNTTAQEWFNRRPPRFSPPFGPGDLDQLKAELRRVSFSGWPADRPSVKAADPKTVESDGILLNSYVLKVQPGIERPLHTLSIRAARKPEEIHLLIPDSTNLVAALERHDNAAAAAEAKALLPSGGNQIAVFTPRGAHDPAFTGKEAETKMRRRFMLLGQTLDGMRVWDIRCAIVALRELMPDTRMVLHARGPMAVNAAFAALYETVERLEVSDLPEDPRDRPDYLKTWSVIESVPGLKPPITAK